MLKSIEKMFQELNQNKIIFCHWKSNEHLEPALDGDTDLDILFDPCQRNIIETVLNRCGIKRFTPAYLSHYNGIEDFVGYDIEKTKIWHLHLHYRLTLGENKLKSYTINTWAAYVLSNRKLYKKNIYTSSPEDELILLVVRMALKVRLVDILKKVSEDDMREFDWLKKRVNKERLMERIGVFFTYDCINEFNQLIENDLSYRYQLLLFNNMMRRMLYPFSGLYRFEATCKGYIRTMFSLLYGCIRKYFPEYTTSYRRFSPAGGSVIAFVGSDGAGKSTMINLVYKELSKKIDVKLFYLGSGDGACSIIRLPMRFVARYFAGKGLRESVEAEYNSSKENVSFKAKVYSIAKCIWSITLAYEKKRKLRKIVRARNSGMVVLLDRYPQLFEGGCSDGLMLNKYRNSNSFLLRQMANYEYNSYKLFEMNPPDLFIKLIVDSDIAVRRKPEMTQKEIDDKRRIVLKMYGNVKAYVIDTGKENEDNTFSLIMKYIWSNI